MCSLNPHFSEREAELGAEVGVLRAENERLKLKLSLAYAKAEALEAELHVERGHHRDTPRRDILGSPLLNRPHTGQW